MSKEDFSNSKDTIKSIKKQFLIKPYEIIVVTKGNIAQGRNEYLTKAKGDIIASFDADCIYEENYLIKMLMQMQKDDADIVIAKVVPVISNIMQEFCALRMPRYDRFAKKDYANFIPSNRQVIFKKDIIHKLGLLPETLYRSDDTFWFSLARKKGLKISYCFHAEVSWRMKDNLKDYLKTIYLDNRCNTEYNIKGFKTNKISTMIFPYGILVCYFAMLCKLRGYIHGKLIYIINSIENALELRYYGSAMRY